MKLHAAVSGLVCLLAVARAVSIPAYLTENDKTRLRSVLDAVWRGNDLSAWYYGALGSKLLSSPIPDGTENCARLDSKLREANKIEAISQAALASLAINDCKNQPTAAQVKTLADALTSEASSMLDLYWSSRAISALGKKAEGPKLIKAMTSALKRDDSPPSLGMAFHVASSLLSAKEAGPFFDRVEDALVQADEVDGKYLQFEGGLSVTSMVMSGAYALSHLLNKPLPLSKDQAVKFANYFMSRRSVQTAKGVYHLVDILKILAANKLHLPVCISLAGPVALSDGSPTLSVKVTDLLGSTLASSLTLTLESASRLGSPKPLYSSVPLRPSGSDKSLYTYHFVTSNTPPGFYDLNLKATPSGKPSESRLIGNEGAKLRIKVVAEALVEGASFWSSEGEGGSALGANLKLTPGQPIASDLRFDSHHTLHLEYTLKDKKTGKLFPVHQNFLRFVHKETGKEVVFVVQNRKDKDGSYLVDVDLNSKGKTFSYLSGVYSVFLTLGDPVMSNPLDWNLGDMKIDFRKDASPASDPMEDYLTKPEIKHLFREAEKRPPAIVSNAFTIIAVLVPLIVLFALWFRLGANVSGFSLHPATLGFHVGLAGIFCLYGIFWFSLDMFTTLKYLTGIAAFTFICGQNALSRISAMRKKHNKGESNGSPTTAKQK